MHVVCAYIAQSTDMKPNDINDIKMFHVLGRSFMSDHKNGR